MTLGVEFYLVYEYNDLRQSYSLPHIQVVYLVQLEVDFGILSLLVITHVTSLKLAVLILNDIS